MSSLKDIIDHEKLTYDRFNFQTVFECVHAVNLNFDKKMSFQGYRVDSNRTFMEQPFL